jgi:pimeloyl-ACP methyl ester carboxylesterase
MWETWSPPGWFRRCDVRRVAASFANPDWAAVTIHAYRSRSGEAACDPRTTKLEAAIKATKRLMTPTVFFHGALDGVTPPRITQAMAQTFVGPFERIVIDGAGHFLPREAAEVVGPKLVEHFLYSPN